MMMGIQQVMITPCKSEQELLERFGCYGFEKQFTFYDVIGDSDWQIDIDQGVIHFNDDITFSIQLLGSFSLSSETWLWSWNNEASQLPTPVIEQALSLKHYGEENNIDLFTVGQFVATEADLYKIGAIAAGMFDTNGFYLADFGQGIALVTVKRDHIDHNTRNQTQIFETFSEFIANFDVNHYQALKYYLIAKDYQIEPSDLTDHSTLVAIKGQERIVAQFDQQSRLISLNG